MIDHQFGSTYISIKPREIRGDGHDLGDSGTERVSQGAAIKINADDNA